MLSALFLSLQLLICFRLTACTSYVDLITEFVGTVFFFKQKTKFYQSFISLSLLFQNSCFSGNSMQIHCSNCLRPVSLSNVFVSA